MMTSLYWYSEYENAVAKLKEINDVMTGIKKSDNDKDSIEFDTNSYYIAKKYMEDCWANYQEALSYETSGTTKKRLTSLGSCDFPC
jgi:heme oxygenase